LYQACLTRNPGRFVLDSCLRRSDNDLFKFNWNATLAGVIFFSEADMPVRYRRIPFAVGYLGWRATRLYSFGIFDTLNPKYPTAHHRKGSYRLEKNDTAPARIPSGRDIRLTGLRCSEYRIHEYFLASAKKITGLRAYVRRYLFHDASFRIDDIQVESIRGGILAEMIEHDRLDFDLPAFFQRHAGQALLGILLAAKGRDESHIRPFLLLAQILRLGFGIHHDHPEPAVGL
jgi:hypothetical protein